MTAFRAALVAALCLVPFANTASAKQTSPAELAATHGFVRVSLPQWLSAPEFELRNSKTKKNFPLERQPADGAYSYGAWLPEGEYEIKDALAQDGGRYEPIAVKSGELTDLGAVLKIQLGGYTSVWLPLQHSEAAAETAAAQARLGTLIKGITSWKPTTLPQAIKAQAPDTGLGLVADLLMDYDRKVNKPPMAKLLQDAHTIEALTPLAKQAVVPRVEEPGVDAASSYYYGADFGQIRVRHADGTWASLDTGSLDEITAVEANGSLLVAGTLHGALLTSPNTGQSWSPLRKLEADEIVVDIDRVGTRWFVLALQTAAGQPNPWILSGRLRVYSAVKDDLSDLATFKDFVLPKNTFGRLGGLPQGIVGTAIGGAYFVNAVSELQKLDLAKLEWTASKPPHRVDIAEASRDGSLITAIRVQGAFSKISVSNDGGATWMPYSRPPYAIYGAVLETPESGTATRWNQNAFSVLLELYEYDPKLKDWRKTGETPKGCVQLLRDSDARQRFCLTSGGSILDRKNGAWTVEFANQ